MRFEDRILIGRAGEKDIYIYPKMANRHGLIAGATGTGKTVTLKVMAESFSSMGVPVFLADVKGDLAGMCKPGADGTTASDRAEKYGLKDLGFRFKSFPCNFWDLYGEKGMPLRTTVTEMGPTLLARILDLNDTQTDVLSIVFRIADDEGLLLIDIKDLRSMLMFVGDNAQEYSRVYGNIAQQSLNAITRAVVTLESEGGDLFFGEPALSITDWLCTDASGEGVIQVLDVQKLILHPRMYSTFLLWMMSELFEGLPEAGDLDKPKMVFFFDEAHLLFNSAPKALLEKIEQVVKLIRSKGVGIYFITQSPGDVPDGVLAQLSNKIQHALRAYTPAEQKKAKAAAQSFRENPEFDTYKVLSELGTGEALISVLDEKGVPTVVERAGILPPQSLMGAIDDTVRDEMIKDSLLYRKYLESFDRDSAYELLERHAQQAEVIAEEERLEAERQREAQRLEKEQAKEADRLAKEQAKEAERARKEQLKQIERLEKERQRQEDKAARDRQKQLEALEKKIQRSNTRSTSSRTKTTRSRSSSGYSSSYSRSSSSSGSSIGRQLGNAIGKSIGGSFGKSIGGELGASIGRGIVGTLLGGR